MAIAERQLLCLTSKKEVTMRKYALPVSILVIVMVTLLVGNVSSAGGPERLWVVAFTQDVPSGPWAEGTHTYSYAFTWTEPTPGSSVSSHQFIVSSDAPLYRGFVLARGFYELARIPGPGGEQCAQIDELHPDQPTRFHIGWLTDWEMTYREARAHFESMTVTVAWDGGDPVEMERHEIKPSNKSWAKNVCSWTVRH
jgi:hypothetical protein